MCIHMWVCICVFMCVLCICICGAGIQNSSKTVNGNYTGKWDSVSMHTFLMARRVTAILPSSEKFHTTCIKSTLQDQICCIAIPKNPRPIIYNVQLPTTSPLNKVLIMDTCYCSSAREDHNCICIVFPTVFVLYL